MDLRNLLTLLIIVTLQNISLEDEINKIEALDAPPSIDEEFNSDPVPCDLKNGCEEECCSDGDCPSLGNNNECYSEKNKVTEAQLELASIECGQEDSDPILCLHHSNSPYLGKFYQDPDVEQNAQERQEIPPGETFLKQAFNESRKTNTLKQRVPTNVLGKNGFCILRPIQKYKSFKTNCMYTLNENTCVSNQRFNISQYASLNNLLVEDNLDIKINPEVVCDMNWAQYISVSRNLFKRSNMLKMTDGKSSKCELTNFSKLDKSSQFCQNIVVGLEYTFTTNRSVITGGKLKISLSDIPITMKSLADAINLDHINNDKELQTYIYVTQRVKVTFDEIDKQSNIMSTGYKLEEPLKIIK